MSDDFEFVDILDAASVPTTPQLHSSDRLRWIVYVPRNVYDTNLRPGQETLSQAQDQFRLDMPRSKFTNLSGSDRVPEGLVRYCTQSVMALPLELLAQCGVVGEIHPSSPMRIVLHVNRVTVRKRLWLITPEQEYIVHVTICAGVRIPTVVIDVRLRRHANAHLRQFLETTLSNDRVDHGAHEKEQ